MSSGTSETAEAPLYETRKSITKASNGATLHFPAEAVQRFNLRPGREVDMRVFSRGDHIVIEIVPAIGFSADALRTVAKERGWSPLGLMDGDGPLHYRSHQSEIRFDPRVRAGRLVVNNVLVDGPVFSLTEKVDYRRVAKLAEANHVAIDLADGEGLWQRLVSAGLATQGLIPSPGDVAKFLKALDGKSASFRYVARFSSMIHRVEEIIDSVESIEKASTEARSLASPVTSKKK